MSRNKNRRLGRTPKKSPEQRISRSAEGYFDPPLELLHLKEDDERLKRQNTLSYTPGPEQPMKEKVAVFMQAGLFLFLFFGFSCFAGVLTWSFLLSMHVENVAAIIVGVLVGIFAVPIVKSFANSGGTMF